jgi:nucleotide-binding universal stress UspA family protein
MMNGAHICPIKNEKLFLSTDGSEFSEGAIREAIGFAKRCSSSLYAMTVLRTNPEYETIASGSCEKD